AELCADAGVDGHRADIATARAAIASAALDGRPKVIESDVQEAARYTLPHRLQSDPFEEPPDPEDLLDDHFDDEDDSSEGEADSDTEGSEEANDGQPDETNDGESADAADNSADGESGESSDTEPPSDSGRGDGDADERGERDRDSESDGDDDDETGGRSQPERTGEDSEPPADVPQGAADSETPEDGPAPEDGEDETPGTPLMPGEQRSAVGEAAAPDIDDAVGETDATPDTDPTGQHSHQQAAGGRGTRVRTEPARDGESVDAAASVRTAAARGHSEVENDDLRRSVREREQAATIVFAVDASASMTPAMEAAKGVVLELLRDAYEQRDEVAFVAFGGDDAEVLLPPTRSVSLAARHLKSLPTGDRTPLPAGLDTARQVAADSESTLSVVVLVTDGRANVADGSPTAATRQAARRLAAGDTQVVIVDASEAREGLIPVIAETTDAETVPLSALSPELVSAAVSGAVAPGED
ncbi:MAG: VWA domain-containing protein, partial [Haloarculaceae archaeon]